MLIMNVFSQSFVLLFIGKPRGQEGDPLLCRRPPFAFYRVLLKLDKLNVIVGGDCLILVGDQPYSAVG